MGLICLVALLDKLMCGYILLFFLESGGNTFHRNISKLISGHTVSHSERQLSWESWPWKARNSHEKEMFRSRREREVNTPKHVGKIYILCLRKKAKYIPRVLFVSRSLFFSSSDIAFYTSLAMQTTPTFHIRYEVDLSGPILKVSWADYSVSIIRNSYSFIQLSERVFSIAVLGSYLV
jgi:hypothetical protein